MGSSFTFTKIPNLTKTVEGYPQLRLLWEDGDAAVLWVQDRAFMEAKVPGKKNQCTVLAKEEPVLLRVTLHGKFIGKNVLVETQDGKLFDITRIVDSTSLNDTIFVWTKEPDDKGTETVEGSRYALKVQTRNDEAYALRFITLNTVAEPRRLRIKYIRPDSKEAKTVEPARDITLDPTTPPPSTVKDGPSIEEVQQMREAAANEKPLTQEEMKAIVAQKELEHGLTSQPEVAKG